VILPQLYSYEHKTDIKPFYLHLQKEEDAHLCPVRALADWIDVSRIKEGYLFRKIWSGDRVADLDQNTAMVCGLHGVPEYCVVLNTFADIGAVPGTV
jgi:hypothetical protein